MSTHDDDLVQLTSCLDLPRAELVRNMLAEKEIPASLGNAHFVSWFWHYSVAVGGVTVHVRRRDAGRAQEVLMAARTPSMDGARSWNCSSCGSRIGGQWDACWQCGDWVDGTPSNPPEDVPTQPDGDRESGIWRNLSNPFLVAAGVVLVALLLKYGLIPSLIAAIYVVILFWLLRQFEPPTGSQPRLPAAAELTGLPPRFLSRTRSAVTRAIVERAWRAAMFAAFAFPPLGFYSMRLLWKLRSRNTPLSRADRWRAWTTFFLSVAAILYCLLMAGLLVSAFLPAFD
jgi:hypothetical protein